MKSIKSLVALLFLVAVPSSFAHAGFFNPYTELYTTGADNSTAAKSVFGWNEKPWLYMKLNNTEAVQNANTYADFSFWINPDYSNSYVSSTITKDNQVWLSFTDAYWNSIKTSGVWNIDAVSIKTGSVGETPFGGQVQFRINAAPEPVSTLLFLSGGFIMAVALVRRRKIA